MHSIPYRPLPKITAPTPAGIKTGLKLLDRVNIQITPPSQADKPFWRVYEVTIIDGSHCRLVTPDKRFALTEKIDAVLELLNLQRQLPPGNQLKVE